ncbi:MAG TPA: orotidine-5'-phosphate decarboxylase [Longimicrobiales bacterium]|nr:orotidine-5'-phosphate decarboxylase [Longimicrobiales bacterium]
MAEIIVALDFPGAREALRMVDRLGDAVARYKVGAELFTRAGPSVVEALHKREKRVFLDLKYHDIPHTVAGAVRAAAELEVELLTLHATGGTSMMKAALEAAGEDGPRLLGVTLLTSFSASDVEAVWDKELRSIREEVARVAGIAAEAGLHGVVASAAEAEVLKRRHGAEFLVVTPGIRPAGGVTGDQVRTATPAEAVRAGADYLVVGRPVIQAKDPVKVVELMHKEMATAVPEVAG